MLNCKQITPDKCRYQVLSTKVEIHLAKAEEIHWPSLEHSKEVTVPLKLNCPRGRQHGYIVNIHKAYSLLQNSYVFDTAELMEMFTEIEVCDLINFHMDDLHEKKT